MPTTSSVMWRHRESPSTTRLSSLRLASWSSITSTVRTSTASASAASRLEGRRVVGV